MMEKYKIKAAFSLLFCFFLLTSFDIFQNPTLTIEIQNVEILKGNIRIGVFNSSEKFLKEGLTFKSYKVPVRKSPVTIVIDDLPEGEYAFLLYHDKNSDGKLNQNLIGIPKEPFAFSNNVKPKIAKPSFNECKFSLDKNKVIKLNLGYFK